MKHEGDKSQPMITGQGVCQSFVIASQAAEARGPSEGAFHHPSAREQDKTALGFMMFDHFQF